MSDITKLPIGIENFAEIRTQGFYYVDKTNLLNELLRNWSKVNLFTRPRRFGKSLNMSMLQYFFEFGCNKELFHGLAIAADTALCEKYMGKFPVISISLKEVGGENFEFALQMLRNAICKEVRRFSILKTSEKLDTEDKIQYLSFIHMDDTGKYDMDITQIANSLKALSDLLEKHYGQKTIILIDEYDVPLDKAYQAGYYDQMMNLIRSILGAALKTNDSLQMAVLTGCLRISKESIFTGLNNFRVYSIADVQFDEYFGFTDHEVKKMLDYYGLQEYFDTMKAWYDGYRFGNVDVYCPWDVINYIADLRTNPKVQPVSYWSNSSGNGIIRLFLRKANTMTVKQEIERLIAGETIKKDIYMELTYNELDKSIGNLWSVLFTTGYLTQAGLADGDTFELRIPNLGIRKIFTKQIYTWFEEDVAKDGTKLNLFCDALQSGDADEVETQFNTYLARTISIRDTFVKKKLKENFYHGILLGLVSYKDSWGISSNKESGDGYSDILIEIFNEEIAIIIEVKYPDSEDLESGCKKALAQIEELHYDEALRMNGARKIIKYGIACNRKKCKVAVAVEE